MSATQIWLRPLTWQRLIRFLNTGSAGSNCVVLGQADGFLSTSNPAFPSSSKSRSRPIFTPAAFNSRRSGGRVFSPPSAADALVPPAPTPAPIAHPLPAGAKRCGAHNNSAGSCSPTHTAKSPSTPGRLRPPGAPPASVLFFKLLQVLVQLLTGHRQERLLQRQFHMRIG